MKHASAPLELKPGFYRHFKGGRYRVIGVGRHSETLEEVVLYEALYENPMGKLWVRPLPMFIEEVEHNGRRVPRFQREDEPRS